MLYQTARRIVIFIVGFTVLGIGIALIVLPGPAFIVIPAGLAILGTEFLWARRLLRRVKSGARTMMDRVKGGRAPQTSAGRATGTPPAIPASYGAAGENDGGDSQSRSSTAYPRT